MTNQKQVAFTKAYSACQDRFTRYCTVLAYGRMEVEDLTQDVLLATYERFDQIKQKDQLIRYLIRAARNRSISHWRKNRYQTELLEKHAEELFSSHLSPETALDVQLLYKTLDRLPEKQRDAIVLFDVCGFSIQEIADIQKSNANTVKSHLSRGRKKLRQLLESKPRSKWLLGVIAGTADQSLQLPVPQASSGTYTPVPGIGAKFQTTSFRIPSIRSWFQSPLQVMHQLGVASIVGGLLALAPLAFNQFKTSATDASLVDQQIGVKADITTIFTMRPQKQTIPVKAHFQEVRQKTQVVTALKTAKKEMKRAFKKPVHPVVYANIQTPVSWPVQSLVKTPVTIPKPVNNLPKSESLPVEDDCETKKITINSKNKNGILDMLNELKADRIIRSKRTKNRFSFSNGLILVNGRKIADQLQEKYLKILKKWGIGPCPDLRMKINTRGVDIRYARNSNTAKGGRVRSNVKVKIRF